MTTHTGTDPYIERTDLFIDGDWQPPLSTETYTVVSPATEEPIGRVPIASAKDVDRAVAAARRAFEGPGSPWAATTPAERAEVMERLADALCARTEELARLITCENGMPIAMSPRANVHSPVGILRGLPASAGKGRGIHRLRSRRGARKTTGSRRTGRLPERGWYVEPTVFGDVPPGMNIAREEIFGPLLAVTRYGSDEEAVALANDSEFGLGGTVWTTDQERGLAIARQVRTGTIGVNTYGLDFHSPFGGRRASGLGRELGPEGLSAYLEWKSVYLRS